ncbi:MAG: hypothetical protein AB8B97_14300 [Granulosicoccus sp.]
MINYHQHMQRSLQAVTLAVLFAVKPVAGQTIPCADMLFLIEKSASDFQTIQAGSLTESGSYTTTTSLPDADQCMILEDPEKRTYQCIWTYPLAAEEADTSFKTYTQEIGDCLGTRAELVPDTAVNHPDTYRSNLYQLTDTQVRITLKNKTTLKSTLVSVFVAKRR